PSESRRGRCGRRDEWDEGMKERPQWFEYNCVMGRPQGPEWVLPLPVFSPMGSSNLKERNASYHQSEQARDPHERGHRAGQGGPKAETVNREEKQADIGNPWDDK